MINDSAKISIPNIDEEMKKHLMESGTIKNFKAGDVILQTLGGKLGSGFSNADREFIQGLIPQLETNPAARRQLISFMQNKNQEIVKESIRLENYARKEKGLSGFEPKIPMSVAPSQPRPYSGLSDAELNAKIRAAQQPNR